MSTLGLIGTGIALGIVHVLTGPDHLSALSTLSASKQWYESWWLGIRWGVGHSTGLIVVGAILIWVQSEQEEITVPKTLTIALESCVGVFMLGLGVYGIWQALYQYRQSGGTENGNSEEPFSLLATTDVEVGVASLSMADVGDAAAPISRGQRSTDSADEEVEGQEPTRIIVSEEAVAGHDHLTDNRGNDHSKCSAGLMALLAGLVHGVAGPGGILGVIPAVQIRDPLLGSLYLGTFCLTSTLTMGCYAAIYGTASKRLGDCGGDNSKLWKFRIQVVSASVTFLVGVMWLVLLSIGKLEDIFG